MKFLAAFFILLSFCAKGSEFSWNEGWYAGLNYSYFDLLVPSKIGASIGKQDENNDAWELEYLSGSITDPLIMKDIGSVTDQRVSFIRKKNIWFKSFYFAYGISYFKLSVNLAEDIAKTIANDAPSGDIVDARALGSHLSIGNMWQIGKHGFFGVDWIGWAQPWIRLKEESSAVDYLVDENNRGKVHDALAVVYKVPRIWVLKLQAGYRF